MTILLVEDNNGLGAAVAQALYSARYRVEWRKTLAAAQELIVDHAFDLIVLDRILPDGDGLDFLKSARADGLGTPVLMISEKASIDDRVMGLDAGADDYLVKPFAFAELIARCRALQRRPRAIELEPISVGNLSLKPDTLELAINDAPLAISRREGELLVALLRRQGRVCTRAYLESALYDSSSVVSPNALETAISRLRSLLSGSAANVELRTVRGVGYQLTEIGQ